LKIGVNEHQPNCLLSSLDEWKTNCVLRVKTVVVLHLAHDCV